MVTSALPPKSFHSDLTLTIERVYQPSGMALSPPLIEREAIEYGGYTFILNKRLIRFRVAKTTPTKLGQFVTIWKRISGKIFPYELSDSMDFCVVSTRKNNSFGQFVFPKAALAKHGIISESGKGGKLAIRVYSPWDEVTSRQAEKAQLWQQKYFLEIPLDRPVDQARVQILYDFKPNTESVTQ